MFSFSPVLIPILVAALTALFLGGYTWRNRQTVGAESFTFLMLALFQWGLTYVFQAVIPDPSIKILLNKLTFLGIVLTPVAWFVFALEYTGRKAWITPTRVSLLLGVPVLTMLVIMTNESHQLFWTAIEMRLEGTLYLLDTRNGTWFWVHAAYSYLLLLAGAVLIVRALLQWPSIYRAQMIWVLFSVAIPWLANIITVFKLLPLLIDLTPIAFTVTGVGMAFALFRHRLLDLAPIARGLVIDGMDDGMIVLNASGQILDMNPAAERILSFTGTRGPLGRRLADLMQEWPQVVDQLRGMEEGVREILVDQADRQFWYEIRMTSLRDERHQVIGQVITAHDFSNRKQALDNLEIARDQALEASKAKSHLLAKVSHELRTPLGSVLGYAELLRDQAFGDVNEDQKRVLSEIVQSTYYLNSMVNELLDEAQVEANKITLRKRLFSPAELLDLVRSTLAETARSKGLELACHVEDGVPEALFGDDRRIRQVLTNLIVNAIKFTKQGRVQIRVFCPTREHWCIEVHDTGIGISPENLTTIFEPFKQADNSVTSENRGIGLGLSITRQLVDLMGGRILVDSLIGRGTTFSVVLPLEREGPASPAPPPDSPPRKREVPA